MHDSTATTPTAAPHINKRTIDCALCRLPITRREPPVLLKSGHSVHVGCYLWSLRFPNKPLPR